MRHVPFPALNSETRDPHSCWDRWHSMTTQHITLYNPCLHNYVHWHDWKFAELTMVFTCKSMFYTKYLYLYIYTYRHSLKPNHILPFWKFPSLYHCYIYNLYLDLYSLLMYNLNLYILRRCCAPWKWDWMIYIYDKKSRTMIAIYDTKPIRSNPYMQIIPIKAICQKRQHR